MDAPTSASPRIAFLSHYAELYGANRSLLALVDGLARRGARPHVILPEAGDLLDALAARAVPVAVLPVDWWVSNRRTPAAAASRLVRAVRHLRGLTAQIEKWECDLVYSNSSVFAAGALAAAELGVPHVWHLREFCRRDYDLAPDLGTRFTRLAFRSADALVCVSFALSRALLGRRPPTQARVIYNGVASEAEFDGRRRAAEATRGRRQPYTFVLVGRFRPSKGQDVAIRALARMASTAPGVRLLLVGGAGGTGDRAYFDHCRALAAGLGLADRVEFWGYIPDPERAFLAADVALMCSRSEAMGRVTAEAMSCCRPVIGYAAGGTPELIEDGTTGRLYRGGAEVLAGLMAEYVAAPRLAWEHGEAGWAVTRRRHSTEVYVAQVDEVIRGVARRT
jgi:glycosyltransferase involved in cell wall biosynthesis